jgi:hypothetical protein
MTCILEDTTCIPQNAGRMLVNAGRVLEKAARMLVNAARMLEDTGCGVSNGYKGRLNAVWIQRHLWRALRCPPYGAPRRGCLEGGVFRGGYFDGVSGAQPVENEARVFLP